jgi:hypothetical protein
MKFELFERVALAQDVPGHHVKKGDVGTIVEFFQKGEYPEDGCALEIFNAVGDTRDVVFIPVTFIEKLNQNEALCVRELEMAE